MLVCKDPRGDWKEQGEEEVVWALMNIFCTHEMRFFISRLIHFIKVQCLTEVGKKKVNSSSIVMIARFLQALCDLCPNLQKCFSLSQSSNGMKVTNLCSVNFVEQCRLVMHVSKAVCWLAILPLEII
jgi:ribosomal protein S27E